MSPEDRGNKLKKQRLEYCVHGHYLRSDTDENGVYGAWWLSLDRMVEQYGEVAVDAALGEYDRQRGQAREEQMQRILAGDVSEDEL
jgi:hypothetical protein